MYAACGPAVHCMICPCLSKVPALLLIKVHVPGIRLLASCLRPIKVAMLLCRRFCGFWSRWATGTRLTERWLTNHPAEKQLLRCELTSFASCRSHGIKAMAMTSSKETKTNASASVTVCLQRGRDSTKLKREHTYKYLNKKKYGRRAHLGHCQGQGPEQCAQHQRVSGLHGDCIKDQI